MTTICPDCYMKQDECICPSEQKLKQQLAESQAREAQLRYALKEIKMVSESSVKTHGYDKSHVRIVQSVKEALAKVRKP